MRLSKDFTLAELIRTSHPTDNTPTPQHRARLANLVTTIAQKLRDRFGPLRVSSGYRSAATNESIYAAISRRVGYTVKPNTTSQHLTGDAVDLVPLAPSVTVREMLEWLIASDLPFDQAIEERSKDGAVWLHVSQVTPARRTVPRRQALTYSDARGYKPFEPGAA